MTFKTRVYTCDAQNSCRGSMHVSQCLPREGSPGNPRPSWKSGGQRQPPPRSAMLYLCQPEPFWDRRESPYSRLGDPLGREDTKARQCATPAGRALTAVSQVQPEAPFPSGGNSFIRPSQGRAGQQPKTGPLLP